MPAKKITKYEPTERDRQIAARQVERRKELAPWELDADGQLEGVHSHKQIGYLALMEVVALQM